MGTAVLFNERLLENRSVPGSWASVDPREDKRKNCRQPRRSDHRPQRRGNVPVVRHPSNNGDIEVMALPTIGLQGERGGDVDSAGLLVRDSKAPAVCGGLGTDLGSDPDRFRYVSFPTAVVAAREWNPSSWEAMAGSETSSVHWDGGERAPPHPPHPPHGVGVEGVEGSPAPSRPRRVTC